MKHYTYITKFIFISMLSYICFVITKFVKKFNQPIRYVLGDKACLGCDQVSMDRT